jgi:hypothetical protein
MTDSKIKSAKKLLAGGVPPRDVAGNLGVSAPKLYGGFLPRTVSMLYCPFPNGTPGGQLQIRHTAGDANTGLVTNP